MHRSVQQFRPSGDPGAPVYSPQRDIANLYAPMMREVFLGLDEEHWPSYFKSWFSLEGITQDDLAKSVEVFLEAHRLFVRDREVDSPSSAFARAGVDQLPDAVRLALLSRLGEVFMGGFFVALRDVTMQGSPSYVHADFMEMLAAGRDLARRLSWHSPRYEPDETSKVIEENREVWRINQQLTKQCEEGQHRIAALELELRTLRANSRRMEDSGDD